MFLVFDWMVFSLRFWAGPVFRRARPQAFRVHGIKDNGRRHEVIRFDYSIAHKFNLPVFSFDNVHRYSSRLVINMASYGKRPDNTKRSLERCISGAAKQCEKYHDIGEY